MVLLSYISDLITLKVLNISLIVVGIIIFLWYIKVNHRKIGPQKSMTPELGATTSTDHGEAGETMTDQSERRLMELTQAYNLESLTVTTKDGFVIISSSRVPEYDAAAFSTLFTNRAKKDGEIKGEITPIATDQGVAWVAPLGTQWADEPLCVIRSEVGVREKTALEIRDEIKKIMENLFTAS
ncbi:MAG: hypothetical protein SCAL_001137 [Candidatus Syntrophoarchaeum caldarius]|uniref:Roadblock/LAMTOR2 domain-containing protein n=1 Tax=Candidatus Syntropharchaeum caldarium TaxID=1838285 RepID=A0A1F2P9Y4_9EURY|nr:MAG: hypothetical protein SCAL_001137 [Candidatus Syntrophoarchaeum caldarius]